MTLPAFASLGVLIRMRSIRPLRARGRGIGIYAPYREGLKLVVQEKLQLVAGSVMERSRYPNAGGIGETGERIVRRAPRLLGSLVLRGSRCGAVKHGRAAG